MAPELAPIQWFHWSPGVEAASIALHGLRPGELSADFAWRSGPLSFAESPALAWMLCADTPRGLHVAEWVLWRTTSAAVPFFETRIVNDQGDLEYQTAHTVAATDLWWVGNRSRTAVDALLGRAAG